MTCSPIGQRIRELIADACALEPGEISDGGKLLGYGLDSVRLVEVLAALEDDYDIDLDGEELGMGEIRTVADLIRFVDAVVERRRAA